MTRACLHGNGNHGNCSRVATHPPHTPVKSRPATLLPVILHYYCVQHPCRRANTLHDLIYRIQIPVHRAVARYCVRLTYICERRRSVKSTTSYANQFEVYFYVNGDRSLHATETTMAHAVLLEFISRDIVILEIRITLKLRFLSMGRKAPWGPKVLPLIYHKSIMSLF